MTKEEAAIKSLEFMAKGYQNLLDNDERCLEAVGKGYKGEVEAQESLAEVYKKQIDALNLAIEALKKEPKWIPVNERLPKDRREVLVTAYWHETYQVMIASYFGDGLWWCVPFNNCGEHMQRLKPKAWMPLPEPYKEERNANDS